MSDAQNRIDSMITRRRVLACGLAATFARGAWAASASSEIKKIHKRIGGRLGVHVLDSQSGRRIGYEDSSRFAMASTFKLPLAAALLWQVDHGAFKLDHELKVSQADLLANSPAVETRVKAGVTQMTVRELCEAIITLSDNAAANVLLRAIGGPDRLNAFLRSIGDETTHLDRFEPALNANDPGDVRDTTTPRAMVDALLRIFTQDVLSIASRALLVDWLIAAKPGVDRVRAGLPRSWQTGDKSGTGGNGAFNDLVITYPTGRRPIFIAVYMSDTKLPYKELAAAQAQIGAIVGAEKWR